MPEVFASAGTDRWAIARFSVVSNGNIHSRPMSPSRNREAALKFLRKAMKRYGRPKTIVTDKLGSYRQR